MGRKRKRDEVDADRQIVISLYFKGYTFRDIAARCSEQTGRYVSHVTVRADIKHILEEFKEERNDMIEHNLTVELERINLLETEYWQGWEKSKSDRKKKSVKKRDSGNGGFVEYSDTEMINMGDPRYLAGVQWCVEMRCKLLGIEPPKKVDVTTGGDKVEFKGFNFLPYTEIK